jgi:hypothetical protein
MDKIDEHFIFSHKSSTNIMKLIFNIHSALKLLFKFNKSDLQHVSTLKFNILIGIDKIEKQSIFRYSVHKNKSTVHIKVLQTALLIKYFCYRQIKNIRKK